MRLLRACLFALMAGVAACSGGDASPRTATIADARLTGAEIVPEPAAPVAPVAPPAAAITGAAAIAAGNGFYVYSGCLVTRAGQIHCWGGPNAGHYVSQRGVPMKGPVPVPGIEGATGVWMGSEEHCALLRDRTARCWKPGREPSSPGATDLVKLTMGTGHACAVTTTGGVQCWGSHLNGALGDPASPLNQPRGPGRAALPGGDADPVLDISAFSYGTCAVRRSGDVVCWGVHPSTGYSATQDELIANTAPRVIAREPGALAVALTNELWILSAGGRIRRITPADDSRGRPAAPAEQVASLPGAKAITAGGDTAYILGGDGRVYEWGPGPTPRMMTTDEVKERNKRRSRLAAVPGLDGVTAVSASGSHACALTQTGHIRCWGLNDMGGLGDGTLTHAETPTFVLQHSASILPDGKGGIGSCAGTDERVRRACATAGEECYLTPPPGHWHVQTGGVKCGPECQEHIRQLLSKRPVPACMCSCSAEYEIAMKAFNATQGGSYPAAAPRP